MYKKLTKKSKKITKLSKKVKVNKLKYNPTFILSMRDDGVEYNTDIFRSMITKLGLKETKNANTPTSYLHLQHMENGRYENKYYETPSLLMNILDKQKSVITNKSNLYFNFSKKYPKECKKYMATTWDARKFPSSNFNGKNVFIIRPVGVGAFSGFGIDVVSNKQELDKTLKKLHKFPTVIISEYIKNPMLWDDKKFHVRSYLLVKNINNELTTYFYDFYEIFTAEKKYIKGDWHNKDIHDTHLKSVGKYVMGPHDFNNVNKELFNNKIYPQMEDCMKYVSKLIEGNAHPYPNAQHGFEIFGCDFMIDEDYNVKLLEVNDHTGLSMSDFPDRKDEFSKIYFGKINDLVLIPYFNPKKINLKSQQPLYSSKLK